MAGYLIDSHIFFWAIDSPKRLNSAERHVLEDYSADIAVSVVSFWELSIRFAKGALALSPGKPPIAADYFEKQARIAGFSVLPIEAPEAEYVRTLPPVHGDPFDRLLISQALLRGRTVMTRDAVFTQYPGLLVFTN